MILDREEFRLWLVAKEPDEVVGVSDRPYGCPLSVFLRPEMVAILSDSIGWPRDEALPEWAKNFVLLVDAEPPGYGVAVTAKQALTILDGIDA